MALIIFPLMIFPVSNIGRKLKKFSHKGQEILGNINATILESFSGVKIVRAFGLEPRELKKFQNFNEEYLKVMKKNVKYVEMTSPFLEVLGVASSAFILWYGGSQVLSGEISQGTFLAFIVALFMMYTPIRILFKIMASIQTSLAGAERVFDILDLPEEKLGKGQNELIGFEGKIEFQDVCFRYPSRNKMVLDKINLTVNKSEVIAIVGMSGAGKTTLVDLLFRFFEVTSGKILIDGDDIQGFKLSSLRSHLSLVTQETFLFNDTVLNNIAFGKESNATREEILVAAKAAHVDSFVKNIDDGYETLIGERGIKLSGGQKQRIAIARAILRLSLIHI